MFKLCQLYNTIRYNTVQYNSYHSMGGAIAVHLATQPTFAPHVLAMIVIDVVEGLQCSIAKVVRYGIVFYQYILVTTKRRDRLSGLCIGLTLSFRVCNGSLGSYGQLPEIPTRHFQNRAGNAILYYTILYYTNVKYKIMEELQVDFMHKQQLITTSNSNQ